MERVLVFGTFDILHRGHKNFFEQARKHGNYLIAVVARDKTVLNVKGRLPDNDETKRVERLRGSGLVDEVVLGGLGDKHEIIKKLKTDVICLGYDQKNFTDNLSDLGVKVMRMKSYRPEIYKSSKIRLKK